MLIPDKTDFMYLKTLVEKCTIYSEEMLLYLIYLLLLFTHISWNLVSKKIVFMSLQEQTFYNITDPSLPKIIMACKTMRNRGNWPGGKSLQLENGSPVKPCGQEQTGMWLTTSHWAFWPQVPGQGSRHLLRRQALSRGHSGLSTHSGRQAS